MLNKNDTSKLVIFKEHFSYLSVIRGWHIAQIKLVMMWCFKQSETSELSSSTGQRLSMRSIFQWYKRFIPQWWWVKPNFVLSVTNNHTNLEFAIQVQNYFLTNLYMNCSLPCHFSYFLIVFSSLFYAHGISVEARSKISRPFKLQQT